MIYAETFCVFNLNTATVRADRENFYTKRYTQKTKTASLPLTWSLTLAVFLLETSSFVCEHK